MFEPWTSCSRPSASSSHLIEAFQRILEIFPTHETAEIKFSLLKKFTLGQFSPSSITIQRLSDSSTRFAVFGVFHECSTYGHRRQTLRFFVRIRIKIRGDIRQKKDHESAVSETMLLQYQQCLKEFLRHGWLRINGVGDNAGAHRDYGSTASAMSKTVLLLNQSAVSQTPLIIIEETLIQIANIRLTYF